ncbi:MAG: hypothetical protein COA75_12005 [Cellvibrionales bacterium]|nr:MAG: hypothetical protein COA75_12005 [Cellvibrionales bacterium]
MNTQQNNNPVANIAAVGGVSSKGQRGAIAVLITLILVVIASLSALVVNKSAIEEQKRSGIDLRNKEVYAAANGALEYGIYQLMREYNDNDTATPAWTGGAEEGEAAAGETATISYDPYGDGSVTTLTQGIDAFSLAPSITYTLLTAENEQPAIIEIRAPVVGVAESHVTKAVSVRVVRANLGTPSMFDGPPLIVENCIDSGAVTGTPDITSDSVAIATITGSSAGTSCIDKGFFDITGGGEVGEPLTSDAPTLFDSMFGGISEATLKEMAGLSDNIYFVTETTPWNAGEYGSLTDPVIFYFEEASGCPTLNGGIVIYGLVYYEAPDEGCPDPGTGAAKVFGTVAYEGDLMKYNGNIELVEVNFSSTGGDDEPVSVITMLPGSWRDF